MFPDLFFGQFVCDKRSDQSQRIAIRFKIHGLGPRHHERAVVKRLVVVSVKQDQIPRRQAGTRADCVGACRSVRAKVGLVGIEGTRGLFFRIKRRSAVRQRVAKLRHGIARVGAKHALPEKVLEHGARRMNRIELFVVMTRSRKGRPFFIRKVDQVEQESGDVFLLVIFCFFLDKCSALIHSACIDFNDRNFKARFCFDFFSNFHCLSIVFHKSDAGKFRTVQFF